MVDGYGQYGFAARLRNTYYARAQAHLLRHFFSKDACVQQQECLRPLAFVLVAGALNDALQLGAAVVAELKNFVCGHGGICWG